MGRLGMKILDNLQVQWFHFILHAFLFFVFRQICVRNVHIRFEDSIQCTSRTFAAGITISQLSFRTTDAEWNSGFVDRTSDLGSVIHKLATVRVFQAYWESDSISFVSMSEERRADAFREFSCASKSLVVAPFSCAAKIKKGDDVDLSRPQYDIDISCNGVSIL